MQPEEYSNSLVRVLSKLATGCNDAAAMKANPLDVLELIAAGLARHTSDNGDVKLTDEGRRRLGL